MRKRSDEKYCLKIIEEIYPLRIFPLYLQNRGRGFSNYL